VKLAAERVVERIELVEPSGQRLQAHARVATRLLIPVDRIDRIIGRQIAVRLPRMIVDGSRTGPTD
jgi:hypothetical protein